MWQRVRKQSPTRSPGRNLISVLSILSEYLGIWLLTEFQTQKSIRLSTQKTGNWLVKLDSTNNVVLYRKII